MPPLMPHEADQPLGHHRAMLRLVMAEIGLDGTRPVDVGKTRAVGAAGAVECATDGVGGAPLEALHQFGDHLGDHDARGFLGLLRHHAAQRDEVGDEVHIGLDGREEFGLDQHLAQALALERVLLDHLDHGRGEEFANVAQPFRDSWCRSTKSAAALLRRIVALAVERGQRLGHAAVAVG